MGRYLLSTHAVEGEVSGAPATPEEMQAFMERVIALEADMEERGAFVFGGALDAPETSAVVRVGDGDPVTTQGPFIESRIQLAGFYIIDAGDDDEALAWAAEVARATSHPIEVRPFRATGRVADHIGEMPGG